MRRPLCIRCFAARPVGSRSKTIPTTAGRDLRIPTLFFYGDLRTAEKQCGLITTGD